MSRLTRGTRPPAPGPPFTPRRLGSGITYSNRVPSFKPMATWCDIHLYSTRSIDSQMTVQFNPAPSTGSRFWRTDASRSVSYTHLRAHETRHDLVCRLLLEKKKK